MKFSVIIPAYNHADVIRRAADSALAQTLAPLEVIVVDDGSADDPLSALGSARDKVIFIRQENKGPAAARNAGAAKARGEWLAFLDADDLWLPEKLEAMAALLEDDPEASLAHSDGWVIAGYKPVTELKSEPTYFSSRKPVQGKDAAKIFLANPVITSSVCIRREAFHKTGGFDETFRINEDADLFLRLMSAGRALFSPLPLVAQYCSPEGAGRDPAAYLDSSVRVIRKAMEYCPAMTPELKRSLFATQRASFLYALRDGDAKKARSAWNETILIKAPSIKDLAITALLNLGGRAGLRYIQKRLGKTLEGLR